MIVNFREYDQDNQYEMGYEFLEQLELRYKRGAVLDEVLDEVRNVSLGGEGAIIIIQGGGNTFLMDRGYFSG